MLWKCQWHRGHLGTQGPGTSGSPPALARLGTGPHRAEGSAPPCARPACDGWGDSVGSNQPLGTLRSGARCSPGGPPSFGAVLAPVQPRRCRLASQPGTSAALTSHRDTAPRHRCGPGVAPTGEALALHAGVGAALAPWRCLWARVQPWHCTPARVRVPRRVPVGAAARFGTPRWQQGLAGAGRSALSSWGRVALQGTAVTPVTPPATGCGLPSVTAQVLARLVGPLGGGTALSPALGGRAGHRGDIGTGVTGSG